jgi:hypothetical protein
MNSSLLLLLSLVLGLQESRRVEQVPEGRSSWPRKRAACRRADPLGARELVTRDGVALDAGSAQRDVHASRREAAVDRGDEEVEAPAQLRVGAQEDPLVIDHGNAHHAAVRGQ